MNNPQCTLMLCKSRPLEIPSGRTYFRVTHNTERSGTKGLWLRWFKFASWIFDEGLTPPTKDSKLILTTENKEHGHNNNRGHKKLFEGYH